MQKYIQRNMNDQAKHIINLQLLLNEYDLENKHLNKQILDLLSENKSLKITKIRSSIVNRDASRIFQKTQQRKTFKRGGQNNKKEYHKNKYNRQPTPVDNKSIKDECLQVGSPKTKDDKGLMKANKAQKQNNISKLPYLQEKDVDAFSFRGDKNTEDNLQTLQESTNYLDMKQTNKINQSQDINNKNNSFIRTGIQNSAYLSPSLKLNSSFQTMELRTQVKKEQPSKLINSQKRDDSHSPNNKLHRSHHAINPSPQITPSQSEKNLMKRTNASYTNLMKSGQSTQQKHQYDSSQKRKKFISMMSMKLTPLHIKTEGSTRQCC